MGLTVPSYGTPDSGKLIRRDHSVRFGPATLIMKHVASGSQHAGVRVLRAGCSVYCF